eukprot:3937444-Rhodomonas_salina.1
MVVPEEREEDEEEEEEQRGRGVEAAYRTSRYQESNRILLLDVLLDATRSSMHTTDRTCSSATPVATRSPYNKPTFPWLCSILSKCLVGPYAWHLVLCKTIRVALSTGVRSVPQYAKPVPDTAKGVPGFDGREAGSTVHVTCTRVWERVTPVCVGRSARSVSTGQRVASA